MTLSNGVLVHDPNPGPGAADLAFTLTKPQLLAMLAGGGPDGVAHHGDLGVLQRLLSVLETPYATVAIVTHRSEGEARELEGPSTRYPACSMCRLAEARPGEPVARSTRRRRRRGQRRLGKDNHQLGSGENS